MQYKIGVFGSAVVQSNDILTKAHELGNVLSKYDLTLITGAGKGLPYQVVSVAKKNNDNIEIWGFPPFQNKKTLQKYTSDDIAIYTKITYIPNDFPFASSIHACRI